MRRCRKVDDDARTLTGCGLDAKRTTQPDRPLAHTQQSEVPGLSEEIRARGECEPHTVIRYGERKTVPVAEDLDSDVLSLSVL